MSCWSVMGDDVSSVLVVLAVDPRRLDGLLLLLVVFFPEQISHEARSYDKIDVGDDMIEGRRILCQAIFCDVLSTVVRDDMYDRRRLWLLLTTPCGVERKFNRRMQQLIMATMPLRSV